jgi:hypothetical protein
VVSAWSSTATPVGLVWKDWSGLLGGGVGRHLLGPEATRVVVLGGPLIIAVIPSRGFRGAGGCVLVGGVVFENCIVVASI